MSFATGLMYEDETWTYVAVDSSKIPFNHPDVHRSHLKSNSYIKMGWKGFGEQHVFVYCILPGIV